MKKGKKDVLFNGKTDSFVVSSGTTGKMKYFPDSRNGVLSKNLIMKLRSIQLSLMCPELLESSSNILGITNSSNYGKTEGGIPVMAASGQGINTYVDEEHDNNDNNNCDSDNGFDKNNFKDNNEDKRGEKDKILDIKMMLPQELISAKDIGSDDMNYLMALFALSEENLNCVVCNNLAHFNFLLKQIKNNTEKMINDLDKKNTFCRY
ncbi:GH3 family domain-containing protein [Methanobrevibacter arboriphilus]|uniref:GH3 family domain-containing protein n=1 Tax=Methanobrevibacter arboriphilus TaxID=39441 RepID=UPI000AC5CF96|nr:GH3 auxin-responsive promoter family protein [Methanobrevibacter arboriphilus]